MRISWNSRESCFEAEFQDFQPDLDAAKAAGFRTTGPPDWKWFCPGIKPLDKLRANRPASGLTIFEDALLEYSRQKKQAEDKAVLLAELKAKKAKVKTDEGYSTICEEGFGCAVVEDSEPSVYSGYTPSVWNGPRCKVCQSPVYMYENEADEICIWCEKELDNAPELF